MRVITPVDPTTIMQCIKMINGNLALNSSLEIHFNSHQSFIVDLDGLEKIRGSLILLLNAFTEGSETPTLRIPKLRYLRGNIYIAGNKSIEFSDDRPVMGASLPSMSLDLPNLEFKPDGWLDARFYLDSITAKFGKGIRHIEIHEPNVFQVAFGQDDLDTHIVSKNSPALNYTSRSGDMAE